MTNFDFFQLQRGSVIECSGETFFVLWRRGKHIKSLRRQIYVTRQVSLRVNGNHVEQDVQDSIWDSLSYTRFDFMRTTGKIYKVTY